MNPELGITNHQCYVEWTDTTGTHRCTHPLQRVDTGVVTNWHDETITMLLHPDQLHHCHCGAEER